MQNRAKDKSNFIFIILGILIGMLITLACFMCGRPATANQVFHRSIQSVVELRAAIGHESENFGTGVIVDNEGHVVTNAHVVTRSALNDVHLYEEYSIRFANEKEYHKVELLKYDIEKDLAVLKVAEDDLSVKRITFGNSEKIQVGDKVYALGNGSNYGISFTQGFVSIPKLTIENNNICHEVIQCDITICPGNSGGALLDEKGRLIGITTFRTKDSSGNVIQGLSYSIPINRVLEFLDS